jgi:hexosaminidase
MAHNNSTQERGICWAGTIEESDIHAWRPLSDIDEDFHDLVLGIQGQLWSETLTKTSFIDQMINPRLASLAEVAWSDEKRRGWIDFKSTLKHSIQLLKKIGWNSHDF